MFEVQLKESAPRRAWTDTTRAAQNMGFQIFLTVSATAVVIVGGLLAARLTKDTVMVASILILMLVGWVFLIVLLVFSFNMMRAPYRQRDEARQLVAKLSTDEVAVATKKLEEGQLAAQFAHWSRTFALGTTVLDSGFNRQGVADLARIGVVAPQIHPGNAYPFSSPLYKPPHTRYFLTQLGHAVLARLEENAAAREEERQPEGDSKPPRGFPI